MHQLLTAIMYRSFGILVLVNLVLVDWTASLAENDVIIKELATNGTTTLATLMDTLCHGQPLHCACFPSLDPGTMDADWKSEIICDHLGITEIPRWSSDHHSDDSIVESNGSTVVVSVSFQQNRLTKILEFNASDVINSLSFDGNDIDEISPCAFQGLPNLRTLSIRDNRLDKIDHRDFHTTLASGGLALEELDLSDNYLVHVDDDAFEQLPRLKVLRLSNNPIHALDLSTVQALNSLHGLRHLQLSHAQLTALPSTQLLINPMRNLLELDLSYNRLLEVPDALQNAVRLVALNLDGNPMYELDVLSFVGLVNLEQLDVNNMINLDTIYRGAVRGAAYL